MTSDGAAGGGFGGSLQSMALVATNTEAKSSNRRVDIIIGRASLSTLRTENPENPENLENLENFENLVIAPSSTRS